MPHFPQKTHITRKDFLKLVGGAFGIGALSYFIGINDHPAPTPGADAPEYIDSASAFPVFRGPYLQKNARLAAMLFPADLAALTAHCNQTINASLTSPFTYIPLTSSLLVVYANMLVSSLDERDSRVGLIPETEVGFWLLTIAMRRTATGLAPDHLAWHLPYLFVDESNATATGREVYGFNKLAGSFTKPGQTQPSSFALNVLAFRQFGPESIAQTERLLEVQSPASQAFPTQWHDWQSAKSDLSAALLPQLRLDLGQEIVEFAAGAALRRIPLAFIKQFRHAANSTKASYQALVEAPMRIHAFRSGGFFSQPHEMNIQQLASHPLAQKLGLAEKQKSSISAWLDVDFILEHGSEYPNFA